MVNPGAWLLLLDPGHEFCVGGEIPVLSVCNGVDKAPPPLALNPDGNCGVVDPPIVLVVAPDDDDGFGFGVNDEKYLGPDEMEPPTIGFICVCETFSS